MLPIGICHQTVNMRKALKKILGNKGKSREYLFAGLSKEAEQKGPMIFCTGMGRSGTHFLARLIGLSPNVQAYHLDQIGNPTADSYYQFCKWNNINIDMNPFFKSRIFLANETYNNNKIYFESNPYLNLSVKDLAENFNCKILIIYRDPIKVVESHYNKGWYEKYNPSLSKGCHPGYHYEIEKPHHFFGRFFPKTHNELEKWNQLTQIGKISWMWKQVYSSILKVVNEKNNIKLIRTESINYLNYRKLCDLLNTNSVNEKDFLNLLETKPGKSIYKKKPEWNDFEIEEFNNHTSYILQKLEENKHNLF